MLDNYVVVRVGDITEAQKRKFERTGKVSFTKEQVAGNTRFMSLHPENAKKFKKSKSSKSGGTKGVSLQLTSGEVIASLNHERSVGAGMQGGSLWSWMKDKAWPWLKKNWGAIKPAVSAVADTVAAVVPGTAPIRSQIKTLTGVGNVPITVGVSPTTHQKRLAALEKARQVRTANKIAAAGFKTY